MGVAEAGQDFGVQRDRAAGLMGARPWLQGSFCVRLGMPTGWEQSQGKQEGEDKAWFSSWRWKKKRR